MADSSQISTDPGQLSLDRLVAGHPLALARLKELTREDDDRLLLALIEFVRNRAANACGHEYCISDAMHSIFDMDCYDLLVKWRAQRAQEQTNQRRAD